MKAFLSYASEQNELARSVALALHSVIGKVFFDRDAIGASDDYTAVIRKAIRSSDVFVFLVTRDSLRTGSYPRAELDIAEHRWRRAAGKILPVVVDDTPLEALPPYLRSVSVLRPQGDVVAEVVDAIARLQRRRRRLMVPALLLLAVPAAIFAARVVRQHAIPARLTSPLEDANPHVWGLANGHHVRLVGAVTRNESNVSERVLIHAIEWGAWRYNYCYDKAFGSTNARLPSGSVVIDFDVLDQLPQRARVQRSDFQVPSFNDCVLATLLNQTINEARAQGRGPVTYVFRFMPD